MGRKQKSNIKGFQARVQDLCKELLRQCQTPPEASNALDYFRSLKSVTDNIYSFQRNLSIVESMLSGDRKVQLMNLEQKYKDYFECKISIQDSGNAGFGLHADEPIEKNTRLLHVPVKDMLFLKNLTTPLPSLPSTYSTLAYLTADDFAIIEGFPAAELVLNTYRNICRQYAYLYLLFDRMKNETVLPNYMKSFCFKDYQWAISTVMSRNNMIPGNEGGVLCLIPLWDMINRKQGEYLKVKRPQIIQLTTDFDPASQSLVFFAMESYQKGDEIFMDYGRRTSTEFLLYSGFVPETNRFHKVPIKLGLSRFDKLMALRTQVLVQLKLSSVINVSVSSEDESFLPSDLIAFARIFVMNEDELQLTLKSNDNMKNLLSMVFSDNRIDNEARKFIEGRLNLLVSGYELRLGKNLQSVQVKGQFHEQCVRLCRQDIATLSQCLTAFVQNTH
ncbi:hypothetical protein ACTXT7_001253 [Hymenolepis weldensis]